MAKIKTSDWFNLGLTVFTFAGQILANRKAAKVEKKLDEVTK